MRNLAIINELNTNKNLYGSDFPTSGFYKLRYSDEEKSRNDLVFANKEENTIVFICPLEMYENMRIEIAEEEVFRNLECSQAKNLRVFSIENNVKAEEALENLKSRIDKNHVLPKTELPTAQLISEDLVPASFVLEFTKALLGKK